MKIASVNKKRIMGIKSDILATKDKPFSLKIELAKMTLKSVNFSKIVPKYIKPNCSKTLSILEKKRKLMQINKENKR